MKRFSFRIFLLCIIMPPVLYVLSLHILEAVIQKSWTKDLHGILISDSRSLLQGRITIRDEIRRNIDGYLASRFTVTWGVQAQIVVKTNTGEWLYPSSRQESFYAFDSDIFPSENPFPEPTEMLQVAEDNLRIMNEGMELSVSVQIPRNTWLANGLLGFYVLVFTSLLYMSYRLNRKAALQLTLGNKRALDSANTKLNEARAKLNNVNEREISYQEEIEVLKLDLAMASERVRETEDEALAEMEELESRLRANVAMKEELEAQVKRFTEESRRLEASQKIPQKKRQKKISTTMKRFKTLYKNLEIQPRAVEGFLNLQPDLQLRAEECIHSMNEESKQLSIKRKVFSKKGNETAFECEFGYRGRIYWRKGPGGKKQILVIGTKNSQSKDLTYLENLMDS